MYVDVTANLKSYHRYTREIPEPAPSLSQHGAQIGGLRDFLVIKITVVHQVCMSPASTVVWAWRYICVKCCTALKDRGRICFAFFCICGPQKPRRPPIWAPWLMTLLHGAVHEVWDRPCIFVNHIHCRFCIKKLPLLYQVCIHVRKPKIPTFEAMCSFIWFVWAIRPPVTKLAGMDTHIAARTQPFIGWASWWI